jgi:hypothetical protein
MIPAQLIIELEAKLTPLNRGLKKVRVSALLTTA